MAVVMEREAEALHHLSKAMEEVDMVSKEDMALHLQVSNKGMVLHHHSRVMVSSSKVMVLPLPVNSKGDMALQHNHMEEEVQHHMDNLADDPKHLINRVDHQAVLIPSFGVGLPQ